MTTTSCVLRGLLHPELSEADIEGDLQDVMDVLLRRDVNKFYSWYKEPRIRFLNAKYVPIHLMLPLYSIALKRRKK